MVYDAIQQVLDKPETANPKALLTSANSKMQDYLNKNPITIGTKYPITKWHHAT